MEAFVTEAASGLAVGVLQKPQAATCVGLDSETAREAIDDPEAILEAGACAGWQDRHYASRRARRHWRAALKAVLENLAGD
jgi:hypothetical protein